MYSEPGPRPRPVNVADYLPALRQGPHPRQGHMPRFGGIDTRLERPVALKVRRAAPIDPPHGAWLFVREARAGFSRNARRAKPTS